jgi:hypothetical protein
VNITRACFEFAGADFALFLAFSKARPSVCEGLFFTISIMRTFGQRGKKTNLFCFLKEKEGFLVRHYFVERIAELC